MSDQLNKEYVSKPDQVKAARQEVIKKFARKEADTGSPEVQVALLTDRINSLAPHFETHPKDFHSKRGLLTMISKRKSLLKYLSRKNDERYKELLKTLGLRK